MTQIPFLFESCKEKTLQLIFKLTGNNHILGHRLWTKDFPKPSKEINIDFLIIGAGISGLSAGRQLVKKGKKDFVIIELEKTTGGNSNYNENQFSKFPIAAHYLPLPNIEDKDLLDFLYESKIITHYENGKPVFDETQLCFDPKERLFIKNTWQEDLIPKYGVSIDTEKEFKRFFDAMSYFKNSRDKLGNYHFMLPRSLSSNEVIYQEFDSITMKEWLLKNEFKSEDLQHYVDYCCRDDFGLGIDYISAWAGIFYFAARKHNNFNTEAVLTWPEGNGRLKSHLEQFSKDNIKTKQIAFDVSITQDKVNVKVFDESNKQTILYKANQVICCTPSFISKYLFKEKSKYSGFEYAPWFTATITLEDIDLNDDFPLCWDNVIHKGKGLGYIYNQQQSLGQIHKNKVITYYYSFSSSDSKRARKELFNMKEAEIKKIIFSDLKIAHPNIQNFIKEIEIFKLGHGMISPRPNFIFGKSINEAKKSIDNKIHFAHSDLSGISVFEEAFNQGISIVNKIFNQ